MEARIKRAFSVLLCLIPMTVYADHEDVFATIFLGFGLTLVLVVVTFFMKIRISGKLLIIALLFTTTYLTFMYTDTLPYYENVRLINTLVVVIPSTVFLISYLVLRARFKTE
jgi:hypothetical protein